MGNIREGESKPSGFSKEFSEMIEKQNASAFARITLGPDEIDKRFGVHVATDEKPELIRRTREKFKDMAWFIDTYIPPGRAKNIALTELETTSMWAIKAIAEASPVEIEDP